MVREIDPKAVMRGVEMGRGLATDNAVSEHRAMLYWGERVERLRIKPGQN